MNSCKSINTGYVTEHVVLESWIFVNNISVAFVKSGDPYDMPGLIICFNSSTLISRDCLDWASKSGCKAQKVVVNKRFNMIARCKIMSI